VENTGDRWQDRGTRAGSDQTRDRTLHFRHLIPGNLQGFEYGKLELDRPPLEWIRHALAENISVLPITPEIANISCTLTAEGLKTDDPADQLICAAARVHRLTLATRDRAIINWNGVAILVY